MARARYANVHLVAAEPGAWQLGVANEATRAKCAEYQKDVESALTASTGAPVQVSFVVSAQPESTAPAPVAPVAAAAPTAEPARQAEPHPEPHPEPDTEPAALTEPPPDDEIDLSELTDAPPESVKSPIDRLAEAFPGSEFVNES
jgi:DNA polymerase-3 subunit gamma/tau